MRARTPGAAAAVALALAVMPGCGGEAEKPAGTPGTAANPLVAEMPEQSAAALASGRSNEAAAPDAEAGEPGYQALVAQQSRRPQRRFTPCDLVPKEQAREIVGAALQDPIEAPQGPTCIYRAERGDGFYTVAVQRGSLDALARGVRQPERLTVSERAAVCGESGQDLLLVSLPGTRVLSIAAPCKLAERLAAEALRRIDA